MEASYMVKSRLIFLWLSLTLILTIVGGFVATTSIYAQTPTPTPASLKLESTFPSLSADSGQSFNFDVDVKYSGERQLFNLVAAAQPAWDVTFTSSTGKTITAIQLGPVDYTVTEPLKITMSPALGQSPEPGDYPLGITVSSTTLTQTINLKATVKAKFSFNLDTETGNLNTQSTAGKENHTSIRVVNTGSAAIDKLTFTSSKPEGWIVTFKPDKIDTIGSGQTEEVDVVVTPPAGKTVAGDYMVSVTADNGTMSQNLSLRVTVLTPTIWGYIGIIIVVVVIAGLTLLFMKLGRR